jgi:hypothetical protein
MFVFASGCCRARYGEHQPEMRNIKQILMRQWITQTYSLHGAESLFRRKPVDYANVTGKSWRMTSWNRASNRDDKFAPVPPVLLGRDSSFGIATRYGDRTTVGARFSAPVQTGSGSHPASYTTGTGSLSRV